MKMVSVDRCSLFYGTLQALKELSFEVHEGEIFGLVGSDGAGKSSLLRLGATMLAPTAGQISVKGLDVVKEKEKVKAMVGYMPQKFALYQDLTVEENFNFFLDVYGIEGEERVRRKERYLGFSRLLPFCTRKVGALSGGMKQKLGLACALVHEPTLLLLDEPTSGVDPVSRQEFWGMLTGMRDQGKTILIATSYLDEGEKCDRLAVMHEGRILAVGAPKEIVSNFGSLEEALINLLQRHLSDG